MNINIYNPYVRSELELYHHGIAGQKWGKRNGPPYPLGAGDHSASEKKAGWRKSLENGSAGLATRELNRLDQKRSTYKYDEAQASLKGRKYKRKAEKAESKGKYEKADKYRNKYNEQVDKATNAKKSADAIAKQTDKILKEMTNRGWNVQSKTVLRSVHRGKNFARSALISVGSSLIGAYTVGVVGVTHTSSRVQGTKYKSYAAREGEKGQVTRKPLNKKAEFAKQLLRPTYNNFSASNVQSIANSQKYTKKRRK